MDVNDYCPQTPKGVAVNEYGCPIDSDNDGIADYIDKEKNTPKGVIVDDYGWEHYKVKGKDYDIRFDPSRIEWACDCKAFTFSRRHKIKYCKHI